MSIEDLTDCDISWLAGYLEGEGSFSVRHYTSKGKYHYEYPKIEAVSTDEDVILRLQAMIGGNVYKERLNPGPKGTYKQQYRWTLNHQTIVRPLLELLLPHMGERRSARIREQLAMRGSLQR